MNSRSDSTAHNYIILITVFTLWGSLYVVSKILLGTLPTFFVAFARYFVAYLFLTGIVFIRQWKPENTKKKIRVSRSAGKYIILLGVVGYTLSVGLQLLGTKLTGASAASLINAANPIAITFIAAMILKEKLTRNKVIGILLAILGVYMVIGAGASLNPVGVLLSVCSVIGWSFTSVMTRKKLSDTDSLTVTRYAIGIAMVCNLGLCIGEVALTRQSVHLTAASVIGLIYMGACCTGLTNILWNRSLGRLPAGNCSALYPIQPMVSTVLGILFLHETVGINFFVGAALITVGILVNLGIKRRSGYGLNIRSQSFYSPKR